MDDENLETDPVDVETQAEPGQPIELEDTFEDSDDYLRSRADSDEDPLVDELDEEPAAEPMDDVEPTREFKSPVEKLFLHDIPRNSRSSERLKLHLTAPIVFRITDSSDIYTLDWSGSEIKVSAGDIEKPGCVILIKERHLMDIAAGTLNPQVAMLSDKIEIEGQMELAVYVFNLIDRRSSWL